MRFKENGLRGLMKSFVYAFRGIVFCIRNERNMRIHLFAALSVGLFSLKFGLTRTEYALLCLTVGSVIVCEMVNTAIEALVNLETSAYNQFARIAKDVAAGAVLVAAIAAAGTGFALFFRFPKLTDVLTDIFSVPWMILFVVGWLILGIFFIFFMPSRSIRPRGTKTKQK
ncbi:MAG TPA: diacylglycerol kinase family protein [Firmicutes bacterium]|nr:diacylglycerol kinase family protein [Bacillota bacterium]